MEKSGLDVLAAQLEFWQRWRCGVLDGQPLPVYFECPVFYCYENQAGQLVAALEPYIGRIAWRVQARVDSIKPAVLPRLHALGLRIIDLGLESAAPEMLVLMNKTRSPERYLRQAAELIEAAAGCGIGVKLNILLYAGESSATVHQTDEFIALHRGRIAGVAATAALEFPGTELSSNLDSYRNRFGTRRRSPEPELAGTGIFPLDLSSAISMEEARAWCLRVTRSVTTPQSYYELKRIGYFPPALTFGQMMAHVADADPADLPFDVSKAGADIYHTVEWDQVR